MDNNGCRFRQQSEKLHKLMINLTDEKRIQQVQVCHHALFLFINEKFVE